GSPKWTFPSRSDCMRCHTTAVGRTIGIEIGQLNGDFVYDSTHRLSNQVATLQHIGVLATSQQPDQLVAYPSPFGNASVDARARAYLHANCAHCHQPNGGAPRAQMDLRFQTNFAGTNTCGKTPIIDDLGIGGAQLIAAGSPDKSIISHR